MKRQNGTRSSGQGGKEDRSWAYKCKSPSPVLRACPCQGLTVQEALGPTLGVQVGLVLLAVEAQQTLLVAEMTDLPTPVDGLQQLSLALTGMAPGSLKVSTAWSDLPS